MFNRAVRKTVRPPDASLPDKVRAKVDEAIKSPRHAIPYKGLKAKARAQMRKILAAAKLLPRRKPSFCGARISCKPFRNAEAIASAEPSEERVIQDDAVQNALCGVWLGTTFRALSTSMMPAY